MYARIAALVVAVLDSIALLVAAIALFASESDPATKGLDTAAGGALLALFAVTAFPALVLLYRRRAPRIALMLALAFPAVFVILFIAVAVTLP